MKSHDEIKRGLECCVKKTVCTCCPYREEPDCDGQIYDVTIAYIQQLEKQLKEKQISYECMCDVSSDYYHEIRGLKSAVPKWISVDERLPHEYETVIVCADDGCVYAAQYWGREMWRRELIGCARSDTEVTPTHWMEMPEAPQEDK